MRQEERIFRSWKRIISPSNSRWTSIVASHSLTSHIINKDEEIGPYVYYTEPSRSTGIGFDVYRRPKGKLHRRSEKVLCTRQLNWLTSQSALNRMRLNKDQTAFAFIFDVTGSDDYAAAFKLFNRTLDPAKVP